MPRRLRRTTDPLRSAAKIAAIVSILSALAILLRALARGDIHPVAGLMAGTISAALAVRWFVRHYAPAIAQRIESMRGSPFPQASPRTPRKTFSCSRWRRLEGARTGLVVPASAPKVSRADGA